MRPTNSSCWSGLTRATVIALILCLLSTSTPAAPQTIAALAKESSISFAFWFRASGVAKLLQGRGAGSAGKQEKQADRNAKVARIQIFPGDVTVQLDQRVHFTAVAYDRNDSPVSGVNIKWSATDEGRQRKGPISPQGEFLALARGTFKIIAEGAGQKAQVNIVVPNGRRLGKLTDAPTSVRPVSNREHPKGAANSAPRPADNTADAKRRKQQSATGNALQAASKSPRKAAFAHGNPSSTTAPATPLLPEEGWNDDNYWSSSDPGNDVGSPPGGPLDGGAGSGNFQFSAPILGLAGRGINISLGVAYNSRVWNKAGNQISFDNDRGWPAPGFSLGFGKLLGMGVYNGGMLVDADGTRHGYTGSLQIFNWGTHFVGHTTDGSLIDYSYSTGTGGGITNAEARLANGTVIRYGAPGPGAVYPTFIEDANGNYITITYVGNSGPRIETVSDTLGRVIIFFYDSNNLLTAVTTPALGSGTRDLVRFHYHQLSLNYGFSGLTPVVRDSNPWVIDAIYYPATSTGYWFGDSDSYSSYGMLAKVVEQRGMGFSASSLSDMGSAWQGQTTRTESYNYPLTPDYGLTDAPTYTSMTESWTRDGTNFDSATTGYEVHENNSPRTVTITLPNGTKSTQYSYNHTGQFDDGLVYYDETHDATNTFLQSSASTWQQGAYDSPRPVRVEKTDERMQTTAAEFSYGSVYNQVIEVRDYDYGGTTLLHSTHTQYQNSSNYTSRHIFNLPLSVELFDSDNTTRLSRTDYQYDGQTLTQRADVIQHDVVFDPYAADEGYCYWDIDWSDPDCGESCSPELMGCDGYCPQIYYCPYSPATDSRGNVTRVTSYANASTEPATIPVVETRRYDITGNMVTASTSCCEQTSLNYTVDTQYAFPQSKTRGSASDPYAQVTTSATYDFNTGLTLSATDANGRQSQTSYESATLRPTTVTLPTGAHTDYAYDDAAMTVTSTTYLAAGAPGYGAIADQSVKLLNGAGQVRQEKARGPDSGQNQTWDVVDTLYNNLGQVYQQSRPYRLGAESPVFSTATYDALGRTRTLTAPDGSATQTFYNEASRPDVASSSPGETTRVQDAWGRERWGRADSGGRLVEVVEPNPGGSGSVATGGLVTTYSYNTVGNLIQTHQDAQTRSFKYDSLGRLTAQKLAEINATLDDAGNYQSSGGTWSDVFTYDERSNVTSRTDARGVKTVYSYNGDPLNRLQSVSWDTSGFGDMANPIFAAAPVNYSYLTKDGPLTLRDITQLSSVTASGVSTESYIYDTEARLFSQTVTLNSRPLFPMVTDYSYDSLDRVTDVHYPAEYGNGQQQRKAVHHNYDIASRLTSLTFDGQSFASSIVYSAVSQTTSLNVGSGANQITENYSYNTQTGLLDSQTVAHTSAPTNYLLNLSYDYANANGKRTGQLTKILNNLNHNKDRGYSYDALGRLAQATGGPSASALWTQTYSYDRYGNRTSVSGSGYSAKNRSGGAGSAGVPTALSARRERGSSPTVREGSNAIAPPSDPKVDLPTDLLAKNNSVELPASARDDGKPISDSPPTLRAPSLPQSGPVFTDDPLIPGVTVIKAAHITELRDAVNQARARAGLVAASWADSITSGVTIKASHIVELRARLAEARSALGLSAASYTDLNLTAGNTVKAAHVQELRDRVREALASVPIPTDGLANLSYDTASNRITTAGFAYDAAGNQTRALAQGGGSQRFKYDAANRLVQVLADNNTTVIASYTYGCTNGRFVADEGGLRTYYAWSGDTTIAEYIESGGSTTPQWSKSYVYLGARLLSTLTPNGSGGDAVQYHHPDRLGTRLVTDPSSGTSFEQVTLPFGTALNAESTGATNRRFTSYDRSATTGLDYAVNRHYDSQQGRFTQVDPIGMKAASPEDPQTLNLYSYCGNDPVNHIDPDGLFSWKTFFKALLLIHTFGLSGLLAFKSIRHLVVKVIHVVAQVAGKILNNRWVRIGIFIASFLVPFLGPALAAIVQTALDVFNTISDIVQTLQLADMLLQHKYKEFALSIAMGLVSAAISVVVNDVVEHVKAYLKGGFRIKDLLNGAWDGLKDGLADVFGRGWESLIPVYGKYCGPGASRGGGIDKGPPIDGIDKLCQTHDKGYIPKDNDLRLGADKKFFAGLFTAISTVGVGDIVFAGHPSGGNVYRFLAFPGFGGLIVGREAYKHRPK